MTEAFLHYVWQHRLLSDGLTTTDGQSVAVLHPGELNRDAGPDFFNARIRIGEMEWVGNVEVHVRSTDWNAHRHSDDAAYNNVILHVVYEHDGEVKLQDGKVPPVLEMRRWLHPSIVANYDALMAPREASEIACRTKIGEVPKIVVGSWLERLTAERIEAKTREVSRLLEESRGGWENVCYWLMARYFGGRVNALAFELLAKATDQRLLARWKDNPERVEALLMGQAGLLEGYFEDDYPRKLQADYEALRAGAGLKPVGGHLWKFYCLRPTSFPTIRISQFARLVSESTNLFSTLLRTTEVSEMERLFRQRASDYWTTHYQFDQVAPAASVKRVGKMQADLLIINAWVPLLFYYGTVHGQQAYKEQAVALLTQLEAECNAIIRQWDAAGVKAAHAADSQALILLYNEYCHTRRCLECRIGFHVLKRI